MTDDNNHPSDDDFNLFRNKRVLYPTVIGVLIVLGILLLPVLL